MVFRNYSAHKDIKSIKFPNRKHAPRLAIDHHLCSMLNAKIEGY